MSVLPTGVVESTQINPKTMILFSKPKVGKTELCAALPNSLLIDVEDGSSYVSAVKVNVKAIAKERSITPLEALKLVVRDIKAANVAKQGFAYKYGIIDTVTALEDMVLPIANDAYRNTPQGKNWVGDDVTTLANGAGYRYTRIALSTIINLLASCFEHLVILGHLKDKMIESEGKEMTERGLDLTGKMASLLMSQVDAIGYMYREDNKTIVNFKPSESVTCGSRSEHLKNKQITVIEQLEDGSLEISWNEIFLS